MTAVEYMREYPIRGKPDLGRGMGRGAREVRKGPREMYT